MSKRLASQVEDDTVANVAEVVWGMITGTRGEFNPDAFYAGVRGMSEIEKIEHYTKLRQTSKQAAYQFAFRVGIVEVNVHMRNAFGPGKAKRRIFVTRQLLRPILAVQPTLFGTSKKLQSTSEAFKFMEWLNSDAPSWYMTQYTFYGSGWGAFFTVVHHALKGGGTGVEVWACTDFLVNN